MKLIVGLGNPGTNYARTRHNVGFLVLDLLAQQLGAKSPGKAFSGLCAKVDLPGGRALLLWPQTYMNDSGHSVAAAVRKHGIAPENVLVIYDDIDTPCGRLRMRREGSAGTHNGMKSIIACLGTQQFPRLRIGIDPAPPGIELKDYVLQKPTQVQYKALNQTLSEAAACAGLWLEGQSMDAVMQRANGFSAQP